jgi:predicted amidohydrolase YtcJ
MARRVGEHVKGLKKGEWVRGGRWDHETWPSKRPPTRAPLDRVTPDNPVLVDRVDGHMALANGAALSAARIDRSTPDPAGGTIVRDASGEPTGVLKDNAIELVAKVVPPATHEQNLRAVRGALKEAARLGVTSLQDASDADALRTYVELARAGELTARLNVWRAAETLPALIAAGITTGLGDDWVRVGAVKLYADGSMGAGTAAFFAPYADDSSTSGLLVTPVPELKRMVEDADQHGLQLAVHAIGDRANALVLDSVQALVAKHGRRDRRFRIEHAQVVRASDLDRYRDLGVIASIQPTHATTDMRWAEKRIGKERLKDAYNVRAFLAKGIQVAFGTDWSVEPLDPRRGLYSAVAREAPDGGGPAGGFKPGEKLTLAEALDLYTRGSAYAEGTEDRKGTLEPGKLADLVVFGADLFALETSDPRKILTAPVELTVVGGRVVFEAKR